jgi:DNA ligase (NAD+)
MGTKSAGNLIAAIEESKSRDLSRLIYAFGIRQVGQKAAKVLASGFQTLDALMSAGEDQRTAIPDIGHVTERFMLDWFSNPQSLHQIKLLRSGVNMKAARKKTHRFLGKTFVLSGARSIHQGRGLSNRKAGREDLVFRLEKTIYAWRGRNRARKLQRAMGLAGK